MFFHMQRHSHLLCVVMVLIESYIKTQTKSTMQQARHICKFSDPKVTSIEEENIVINYTIVEGDSYTAQVKV